MKFDKPNTKSRYEEGYHEYTNLLGERVFLHQMG